MEVVDVIGGGKSGPNFIKFNVVSVKVIKRDNIKCLDVFMHAC